MKLNACGEMSLMDKSLRRRVELNYAILKNRYWYTSYDNTGHERFQPVGRGVPSSPDCAKWLTFMVCDNVEGHEGKFFDGEDCTGKVVARHKHMWCHKATCPVCFIRGWSIRGARSVANRLEEGVRRGFGKVEHVMVSVPFEDYDLDEKVLRKKARLALLDRGVVGGCMIFHGFRIDRKRDVLVWNPHYHVLGFIAGGFDRCRECVHGRRDCYTCSGFKGKEVRGFAKDHYLVKVLREREKSYYGDKPNIFGTGFYQLHHATVKVSAFSRFHVVTWFGICGNRKYETPKSMSEDVCPVCGEDMTRSAYVGKRHIVKDIAHPRYAPVLLFDRFGENGEPNFIPCG